MKNPEITLDWFNQELSKTCRSWMSFFPEKNLTYQTNAITNTFKEVHEEFLKYAKTEDEIKICNDSLNYFKTKYIEGVNAMNQAQSGVVSSMITWPARFKPNTRANNSYEKRSNELLEIYPKVKANLLKFLKKHRTREAWGELEEKKAQLEKLEDQQNKMKQINKICMSTKKSNEEKIKECEALEVSESVISLIITELKDFENKKIKPIPSYSLTNLNARVKRLKDFILRDEKIKERSKEFWAISKLWEFKGGEIIQDLDSQRINIIFNWKPEAEIIQEVKQNGFKWSWKTQVWTRKLTPNAVYSVKRLLTI